MIRRLMQRARVLGCILTAALALAAVPVTAAPSASAVTPSIAEPLVGGVTVAPQVISNDHTNIAVRLTGTGLTPLTDYNVKVRFTEATSPAGATNRGFTFNETTGRWAQERDNWSNFSVQSTDASGALIGGTGGIWMYTKFGDTLKSGTYYVMMSVQPVGSTGGNTSNASVLPTITIIDPRTTGSWVHNGVDSGLSTKSRVAATDAASSSVILGLVRTEPNLVDDDSDGIVDNENYGPAEVAGSAGDFRMAVPAATLIDIRTGNTNGTQWAPAQDVMSGPADTDIALGAAEMMPPTAPSALEATAGDASVALAWTASDDATGVEGYWVYRTTQAAPGASFTPITSRIATVTGATDFTDSTAVNGTPYAYEIRAFDAATNVSARSNSATATATDSVAPEAVDDLAVSQPVTSAVDLSWTAPGDDGAVGTAAAYDLRYSSAAIVDTATFDAAAPVAGLPAPAVAGSAETFSVTGLPKGSEYHFALRTRDEASNWSPISNVVTATPLGEGAIDRTNGATRYDTAVTISEQTFDAADAVVVASGASYPDALSASGLAGTVGGPLLLTAATLPAGVVAEIDRLGATEAFIIGGTGAVSAAVEASLTAAGLTVTRVGGATRYATAALVAEEIANQGGDVTTAFFARGDDFADALALSPVAYATKHPVLLVRPTSVPTETAAALTSLGTTEGVLAGGTGAINEAVRVALGTQLDAAPTRLSGADRYATAVTVAGWAVAEAGLGWGYVGMASGTNFPDALGGGAATGARGGVLLLTRPDSLPDATRNALHANRLAIDVVDIFGGVGAVNNAVTTAIATALAP